jgi:hypothetical protein
MFLTHFLPFERPLFCHVQPLFWQQKGAKFPEKKKKKKNITVASIKSF